MHGLKLFFELRLVRDIEEIGDVVALVNLGPVGRQEAKENIAGEQGLFKGCGFPPILVNGLIAGKRHAEPFAPGIVHQLLFPPRSRVGDIPE